LNHFSADELPFNWRSSNFSEKDFSDFAQKKFNRPNPSLLVLSRPKYGIAFLTIRSNEPDDVIGGMYEQLKRGSTQFSGSRPAFLCAHFLDLTPEALVSLHADQQKGKPSNLNVIVTRLFKGNRPFLHTVQFTVPGRVEQTKTVQGDMQVNNYMETGPAYSFTNSSHPLAPEPDLKFFS